MKADNTPESRFSPARSGWLLAALVLLTAVLILSRLSAGQRSSGQATATAPLQTAALASTPAEKATTPSPTVPPVIQPSSTDMPLPSPSPTATVDQTLLCSPVDGVPIGDLDLIISQEYSVPNQHSDSGHHGVDLGSYNYNGQYLYEIPIRAILPGKVAGITVDRPPIGNVVILETPYEDLPDFLRQLLEISPGQSLYHMYGHFVNEPSQQIGDQLECGEQINLLGKSRTVEAHLHLETRVGQTGLVVSQMAFYDAATTEEERAEYLWWRTSGEVIAFNPMDIFHAWLEQSE